MAVPLIREEANSVGFPRRADVSALLAMTSLFGGVENPAYGIKEKRDSSLSLRMTKINVRGKLGRYEF